MKQVNVSECRAKDPRTCYYHGAYIRLEETMAKIERASKSGEKVSSEDWNTYYDARRTVEDAERELSKRRWLKNEGEYLIGKDGQAQTPSAPVAEPDSPAQEALPLPPEPDPNYDPFESPNPAPSAPSATETVPPVRETTRSGRTRGQSSPVKPVSKYTGPGKKRKPRQPVVPNHRYDPRLDAIFPPTVTVLGDEKGRSAVLVRSDQANFLPRGVMLATGGNLTQPQKEYLANALKYVHTRSTRTEKITRPLVATDFNVDNHSARSVYARTHITTREQMIAFQNQLQLLLKNGSEPRKDGSQKIPPFSGDAGKVVVYYAR